LGGDVNIEISGGGSFSNAGTFAKITTAGISRVEADFENNGMVDVQSGTLGFDGAFTNQAGALVQGSGTLDLSGAGFSNDGIFSPGASPGILSVSGNYYQSAAAQLQVEVAGDSAGTAYDRLQVSGNATLDGDLTVSLDGGYLPLLGQQFSILTGANRSGSFASVQLPQHDGNDIFSLSYTDSSVILTAIYVPAFQLTVETAGGGSVSLNPPGGAYDSTAVVTLTALPDPGYVFIRWEGDLSGSANPDSLVMDGDKTVTAVFEQKFALDVQTSGSGSVALNPAGGIYDSATVVT
ncbi:MAG: hypothetical protein KDG51_15050, partial [Calditrichaeota bacterium]|nr:hypothetical protein [Calditrichota bacterium]